MKLTFSKNLILTALVTGVLCAGPSFANSSSVKAPESATVKGFVADAVGVPIKSAVIWIFKRGSMEALKKTVVTATGEYSSKLAPGSYTLVAIATGYESGISKIDLKGSEEVVSRFNLLPAGQGRTLPERKGNRSDVMWAIRAAQLRRSVFQLTEEDTLSPEEAIALMEAGEKDNSTIVETLYMTSSGNVSGISFTNFQKLASGSSLTFSGQLSSQMYGVGEFGAEFQSKPWKNHEVSVGGSLSQLKFRPGFIAQSLNELSLGASDEWRVLPSVIILAGIDISLIPGASTSTVINPRAGLTFKLNNRTKLVGALNYTPNEFSSTRENDIPLSTTNISFLSASLIPFTRSTRMQLGLVSDIDSDTQIEASVFSDSTSPYSLRIDGKNHQGVPIQISSHLGSRRLEVRAARLSLIRKINQRISVTASYAFGVSSDQDARARSFNATQHRPTFHMFSGGVTADLGNGTNLQTVLRLSSDARIFAIDPFQGRVAIYDPSLSVVLTKKLPNIGLPVRAEAIIDARNLFDERLSQGGDSALLKFSNHRRLIQGGIKVRF